VIQSRIIFVIVPLSPNWGWFLRNIYNITNLKQSDPKIYFRFGAKGRIEEKNVYAKPPFKRIDQAIKQHQELFNDEIKIYHGWELAECVDELVAAYPDAEFLIGYKPFNPDAVSRWASKHKFKRTSPYPLINRDNLAEYFYDKSELQHRLLDDFLKNQKLEEFNVYQVSSNETLEQGYKFYYINKP